MRQVNEDTLWKVTVEDSDNQLGLINTIRYLEKLNLEIDQAQVENLILELDLEKLANVNSELIAQFVLLQSSLVRTNGHLQIINANLELKSSFDVVMLDKIISITYAGGYVEDSDDYSEE